MPVQNQNQYGFKKLIKDMFVFIEPYKRRFYFATFFRIIGDLCNLYPAWAVASTINYLADSQAENRTEKIALLMLGWLITKLLRDQFKQWAKYWGYQIAEQVDLDAKAKTINHIFLLDLAWQEKLSSGNKMKKINNGGRGLQELIRMYYSVLIEAVINTLGICLALLTLDPILSLALFAFILIFYSLSFNLYRKAAEQEYLVKKKEEQLEGIAFESVNNIQTLKALNLKARMIKDISETMRDLFVSIKRRIYLFQISVIKLASLSHVFEFLMYVYLIYAILDGKYEVGVLVLFSAYLEKTVTALWELTDITQQVFVYKIWVHRMIELFDIKPTIETSEKFEKYPENWEQMTFKNLKFSYGDRNTIDDLDLIIKRGEKVGIVGLSGAGKSTLFKLLLDLYHDYSGLIDIGGVNLKEIDRSNYINNLAVVLQDTELFNASLEENIKIAGVEGLNISDDEMQDIYKTAYLSDLLEKLPDGKDTIVGEKGVKLSGGERQRVGIARALYRRPDILLLDEATSHLDADSEKKIQSALKDFFKDVTAIVIAHRLSTLKEMDRIIVMHEGKIVEQGTFEQLQKKGGHFAKLWKMQRI